jgi:hypothetical protein
MSKAQFEKAVSIVQGLPTSGPIQLTQDEKLVVRYLPFTSRASTDGI